MSRTIILLQPHCQASHFNPLNVIRCKQVVAFTTTRARNQILIIVVVRCYILVILNKKQDSKVVELKLLLVLLI
jgi:hypothetical protein